MIDTGTIRRIESDDKTHIPKATVHTLQHTFTTHTVKKGTKLDVDRRPRAGTA